MIPISRLIQLPTTVPIPWGFQWENNATILEFPTLQLPTAITATRQDGTPYLMETSQWQWDSTKTFCRITLLEKDTTYAGRLLLNAQWVRTDGTVEKSMLFRGLISPATAPLVRDDHPVSGAICVVEELPTEPSENTLYILAATHEPYAVVEGALVRLGTDDTNPLLAITGVGQGLEVKDGILAATQQIHSSPEIAVLADNTLEIQYVDVSKIKGDFALACGTAKS